MIRVLNVISDQNIGGAGRCILNFLKHYDRKRFSVSVAVPKGSLLVPELQKLDTKVIEVDGMFDQSFDWKSVRRLKAVIREERPEVVHTHGALSARVAARLCGKCIVFTRHSVFPVSPRIQKGFGHWLNGRLNEYLADEILAVAEAAKENLTDGGVSPGRVRVILNGVEAVPPNTAEENAAYRTELGLSSEDFVIGILARLEAVKGHIYLIDAAEKLTAEERPVKVLIAGAGEEEARLKAEVARRGLTDTVRFLGFVSDVPRLLNILDVQANASYGTEATSLSLLEGMSLGLPAVVSDYGGNPGVITHGVNGFLFPEKDSTTLAELLRRLMDEPETRQKLRSGALEVYKSQFTAEQYAKNIEMAYARAARHKGVES